MIKVEAKLINADKAKRYIERERLKAAKAQNIAVRVEAGRLMEKLRREIRTGAPGGKRFAPLSTLARRSGGGKRLRPDRPLFTMARAIGLDIVKPSPLEVKVGFVGRASSDTWRKLAKLHQEGFSFGEGSRMGTRNTGMDERKRAMFRRTGATLSMRAKGRQHLFIKKSTHEFKAPARPIIDPFWRAHRQEALRNIRKNIVRKLEGERI